MVSSPIAFSSFFSGFLYSSISVILMQGSMGLCVHVYVCVHACMCVCACACMHVIYNVGECGHYISVIHIGLVATVGAAVVTFSFFVSGSPASPSALTLWSFCCKIDQKVHEQRLSKD